MPQLRLLCVFFFFISLWQGAALATFIPDKDIKNPRVFTEAESNITKGEFERVIELARAFYGPVVDSHGAQLDIRGRWDDDTLNASATQIVDRWIVNMYGGLARHPEMTLDGFSMVICHEMGHHLAGYSFVRSFFTTWAANEGQSDYFAAHSCARDLWQPEVEKNALYSVDVPDAVKTNCERLWREDNDKNLCYRIHAASESLARVLSDLKGDEEFPQFETPDTNMVAETNSRHPEAQCRLDTMMSAAVCSAEFSLELIPGKKASNPNGSEAEKEAAQYTCMQQSGYGLGLRPRCWFKAKNS